MLHYMGVVTVFVAIADTTIAVATMSQSSGSNRNREQTAGTGMRPDAHCMWLSGFLYLCRLSSPIAAAATANAVAIPVPVNKHLTAPLFKRCIW